MPETDVVVLESTQLKYTDVESDSGRLVYTVTSPPYLVYKRGEKDAGRLVATHKLAHLDKQTNQPAGRSTLGACQGR